MARGSVFGRIKVWVGEILYPNDLNGEFNNILNSLDLSGVGSYYANVTEMQSTSDPAPSGNPVVASSALVLIRQILYQLQAITGNTYWYQIPTSSLKPSLVEKTADYTMTVVDAIASVDASGGAVIITLPTAVGVTGKLYGIKKTDNSANTVTLKGDGTELIDGANTLVLTKLYDYVLVQSTGAKWIIVGGLTRQPTIADLTNMQHGHANAAGGGQLTATSITAALGAWDATKSIDTVYQASTDLFVILKTGNNGNQVMVSGLTDASNPPTTERAYAKSNQSTEPETLQLYFFVRKGHYWKIATTNSPASPVINIIPLGS